MTDQWDRQYDRLKLAELIAEYRAENATLDELQGLFYDTQLDFLANQAYCPLYYLVGLAKEAGIPESEYLAHNED